MNTGTAIVAAGALIAGAIVFVNLQDKTEVPSAPEGSSAAPEAPHGTASGPGLMTASSNRDADELAKQLREAHREIHGLKAGHPAAEDASAASPLTPVQLEKQQEHFLFLRRAYTGGKATKAQITELLALTKNKQLMERVVGSLEEKIAENPDDLEARMELVEVQSARVHSAESITERAILRNTVRDQLGQVLERDASNWDARYMRAVGISHSQRTPQGRATAIREFESLIALQQERSAEPRFADTYGQLARVYLSEENGVKARETIEAGLSRHPDDEELKELLAKLPEAND